MQSLIKQIIAARYAVRICRSKDGLRHKVTVLYHSRAVGRCEVEGSVTQALLGAMHDAVDNGWPNLNPADASVDPTAIYGSVTVRK